MSYFNLFAYDLILVVWVFREWKPSPLEDGERDGLEGEASDCSFLLRWCNRGLAGSCL